jgi:O-acetyl-ADP-ribose deacetylase (regulator of RNase III)
MTMKERIQILKGDITRLGVDGIVNAANSSLLGGGGVDGAIHRAAGAELYQECRMLGGCLTGQAKITRGYNLPAKYVIHTVGPVWNGGAQGEPDLLASCYRSSLALAAQNQIKTIAFPAISCGIYGYPIDEACEIAINETLRFLDTHDAMEKVIFACFEQNVYDAYLDAFARADQHASATSELSESDS